MVVAGYLGTLGLIAMQTPTAPDIVVIEAVRELSDRTRALEALSTHWSIRERLIGVAIVWAGMAALFLNEKYHLVDVPITVGVVILLILAVAAGAWTEVSRLRRKVEALTYLLLQRERASNEP